jgi:polyphosphate kinase
MEVVAPITARSARERLWQILDVSLRDRRQAWTLDRKGDYTQPCPEPSGDGPESLGSQQTLLDRTRQRSPNA